MGIHTALDSNGYYGERLSDAELDTIDLALLNIKGWDPGRHRSLTGMDNATTLEFAGGLAARRRPIWVRYVLVPGLTDDLQDIESIARFAAALSNVERVDVLPFHQMERFKRKEFSLPYALEETRPPPAELVGKAVAAFQAAGLTAY
jgi:pyruvate formate lyase activating enzyme